jgi:L-threonine kinase
MSESEYPPMARSSPRVMADAATRPQAAARTGSARVPGTCGELVQGQLRGGVDFLITLPVDLWSEVRVRLDESGRVDVNPPHKVKTRAAVRRALDGLGLPEAGAQVAVTSALPEGKGMASSTADVVAVCRAAARAAGRTLTGGAISRIARGIEPSDGVMYPGAVAYNHRRCALIERLGPLPPFHVLIVDSGGTVDTLAFNRRPKDYTPGEMSMIAQAYEWAAAGVRRGDRTLIGRAATLSARVNQRILPKPHLGELIAIAEAHGAYGVNVAHSGTVAGLLFDPGVEADAARAVEAIRQALGPEAALLTTGTVDAW